MGFLSDLTVKDVNSVRQWRQRLGQDKEESSIKPTFPKVRGGSYGRSSLAEPEAYKRLLQAMRSFAPGGWTDDRWEETKHYTGIVYLAGHRIGEQLAQSTFEVKVMDSNQLNSPEEWPLAKGPAVDAIRRILECPNSTDHFGDYLYKIYQQMILTGSSLTWMVPNVFGVPYELYSIPTAIAIPQPCINPDYPDGYYRIQPLYPYGPFSSYPTPATAVGAPIPAQWMLRIKYPHPLVHYDGYSPQTGLRLHIDEFEGMDRSRWYSMMRVLHPSAVLNFEDMDGAMPLPEEEIQRIKTEFENEVQGPENVGKLLVATPGGKLEEWGKTNKEMEYHQSWDQLLSFLMAALGITKPAAGILEESSYSTLFAALKQMHLISLGPTAYRLSWQLSKHLTPFFTDYYGVQEKYYVHIKLPKIDDHEVKSAKIELMITAQAITKNEVRKELGFEPTNEPWGEEIAGEQEQQEGPGFETKFDDNSVIQTGPDGEVREMERQFKPPSESGKQATSMQPGEVTKSRPKTGAGMTGARKPGARKMLPTRFSDRMAEYHSEKKIVIHKKSLLDLGYEVSHNGFHIK